MPFSCCYFILYTFVVLWFIRERGFHQTHILISRECFRACEDNERITCDAANILIHSVTDVTADRALFLFNIPTSRQSGVLQILRDVVGSYLWAMQYISSYITLNWSLYLMCIPIEKGPKQQKVYDAYSGLISDLNVEDIYVLCISDICFNI